MINVSTHPSQVTLINNHSCHLKYSNIFFSISSSTGISLQEAIYGTKTLERLEGIKETIDPNYMFDCYSCIGNNRVKSVHGPASSTPTSIDEAPPTQSPTEGTSSAIASPDGAPPTRSPTEGTSSPIASIDGAPPTQSPTEGTSSAIAIVTSVQTFFQIILVGAFVSL